MNARRVSRFWILSLAFHFCLAVVLGYIVTRQDIPVDEDAIDVTILRVTPVTPVERKPRVEAPNVVPMPAPEFRVQPQTASAQSRSVRTHQVRPSVQTPASTVAVSRAIAKPRRQVAKVSLSALGDSSSPGALATMADLPVQSDSPLIAGPSRGGGLLTEGVGEGNGGLGVRRSSFGSGSGIRQGHDSRPVGLTSLVGVEGAAGIDASLSDVTEVVALGGGVQEIPNGAPGAIIQGRGRDIIGRLNLVRFDDPLHPNADI